MTAVVTELEPAGSDRPVPEAAPRLASGVELIGPYRDSGLENPPYLFGRAGRIIQVSRLLYVVAAAADGSRSFDDIATVASGELDRALTSDDIRFLVRNKLAPAGFLTVGDEPSSDAAAPARPAASVPPPPAKDTRLFALRFRQAFVSPEAIDGPARFVGPLFRPPVVAAVLATTVAIDVWLFGTHDVMPALRQVSVTPALMLFVLAVVGLSGAFHELGHAAGCRYSGGRPGAAGVGLYLCWPVFYSNVTDTYRLDRRGRLRTDLGGIYFNAVCIVVLGAAYAVTGWEPLVALVVLQHGLVFHQFVPWIRADGFYIVSDLTGVPDILSWVKPALLSLIPGRPIHPDVRALRPGARRILYGYLISLVGFVVLAVVPTVLVLPFMLAASLEALGPRLSALGAAAARWDTVMVLFEAVQVVMLALPIVGLTLTFGALAGRGARAVVQRTRTLARPRPVRHRPVRHWLEASDLAIVDGTELPGGGAIDHFGFGPSGEVVLFGTAIERSPEEVAKRLLAAAREIKGSSSDRLDRVLLDGPPFLEVVAAVTRRSGRHWDEPEFRASLEETLAGGDFRLLVLRPSRRGRTLRVYPLI